MNSKVRLLLNDPQNSYNPCTRTVVYIYMQCCHIVGSFNCQLYCGCMAKTHAFLSSNKAAYFSMASQFVLLTYKKKMMLCFVSKLRGLSIRGKLHFNFNCKLHNILMPLHMESDSCDNSGVRIFTRRNILKNFVFFCFAVQGKFY